MVERDDPLTFVLRNRPADDFLELLLGKPPMIPLAIRRSVRIHPESFRRLVSNLHEFSLIAIRTRPYHSRSTGSGPAPLRPQVEVSLTRQGKNVLTVARAVHESVSRQGRLLPAASQRRWLSSGSPAVRRSR